MTRAWFHGLCWFAGSLFYYWQGESTLVMFCLTVSMIFAAADMIIREVRK